MRPLLPDRLDLAAVAEDDHGFTVDDEAAALVARGRASALRQAGDAVAGLPWQELQHLAQLAALDQDPEPYAEVAYHAELTPEFLAEVQAMFGPGRAG